MYEELIDKLNELEQLVCANICVDREYCMNYDYSNQCSTNKYVKEVLEEFEDLKLIIERMEMVNDNN